jgi:hypothetical protein
MDERDRDYRDRPRSGRYGRDYRGGEAPRWGEARSWTGADDDDGARYGDPRDYEPDRDHGRAADLTTGGAYSADPTGVRDRYSGVRFSAQDYTGRGHAERRDYDFGTRGYGGREDWRYRQGADYGGQPDWMSERDIAWARYSPEDGGRRDYRPERRRREDWRDAREDPRHERAGDFLARAGDRISSWFRGSDLLRGSRDEDYGEPGRYREDYEARPIPRGEHRGRGPRGYKRTDERISEEVHERLTEDPWLDASDIDVEVTSGEVTLGGHVDNREAKHRAERLIEDLSGVTHVQNNLRVDPDHGLTGAGHGLGSSVLEAQMRRASWENDPGNNGASGRSGRTSTGAAAERSTDERGET